MELQLSNPLTKRILEHLAGSELGEEQDSGAAAELKRLAVGHELAHDGVLLWKGDDDIRRIVLPPQLKPQIFKMYHDRLGHLGIHKCAPLVYDRYYWGASKREMRDEIAKYISHCMPCIRIKMPRHKAGEGHLVEHGCHPYDIVSVDNSKTGFVSPNGYDGTTTWGCNLSRNMTCCPVVGDPDSREIVRLLVWFVIRVYGTPRIIRSDNASVFTAAAVKFLYARYGIRARASASYHHQTVGLIERFHSTLKSLLLTRRAAAPADDAWEEYLPFLELAFNVTINTATGLSPAFVIHGRQLRLPMDALVESMGPVPPKLPDWVDERLQKGSAAIAEAFKVLNRNAMASKKRYDFKHDVGMKFRVGQQVILIKGAFIDGNLPKAEEPTFETLYTVSRVLENDNYELQTRGGQRLKDTVHVSRMLPA